MGTYSILKSSEGGYTIKEVKQICKEFGVQYIGTTYSPYIGHRAYVFKGETDAFTDRILARG